MRFARQAGADGLVALGVVLFLLEYFFGKKTRPPGAERGDPAAGSKGDI